MLYNVAMPKVEIKKLIFGFRAKVTAVAILTLLFTVGLSNFFIYRASLDNQFQQLRQQLMIIAQTSSLMVDADELMRIPLRRDGTQTPEYQAIASRLKKIKELNPSLQYLYTLRKTDKPDVWQFVVDLDPESKVHRKKDFTAFPGDKYMVGRFPEMIQGFNGPAADQKLMEDEWGVTLSGYAPIRDRSGAAVAVLGVDMDAQNVQQTQEKIHRSALLVILAGIFLSILLGIILSGRMTKRIKKLIEGTRKLSAGDLEIRVEAKGHDEITELSDAFNQMASSLLESRKKLEDYFFRVVQSLVRMLEAKDKYTQGHSERVGVYAQKLALKMGFPQSEADLLRKAGELHDIGKLAIHEQILTKAGPLTEEEWEIIRQHPVIGAEALKPVCFNEIIMAGIHFHHERHDGMGYPQKLKGDEINIFAQIISVVDAYDAMTTTRPYRKAVDKKTAIDEIKKHSGTQFHPAVAEAFVLLMEEDE